jgi:hypothetical protein
MELDWFRNREHLHPRSEMNFSLSFWFFQKEKRKKRYEYILGVKW